MYRTFTGILAGWGAVPKSSVAQVPKLRRSRLFRLEPFLAFERLRVLLLRRPLRRHLARRDPFVRQGDHSGVERCGALQFEVRGRPLVEEPRATAHRERVDEDVEGVEELLSDQPPREGDASVDAKVLSRFGL